MLMLLQGTDAVQIFSVINVKKLAICKPDKNQDWYIVGMRNSMV